MNVKSSDSTSPFLIPSSCVSFLIAALLLPSEDIFMTGYLLSFAVTISGFFQFIVIFYTLNRLGYSLRLKKPKHYSKINEFYDFYIGVNPSAGGFIVNEEKIKNLIPSSFTNNLHLLKRQVANTFLGELALKHNLVVVPYFEGVGVGNKIRGKYADQSEAFLLQIPEPTYFIDFNLRGFVKQKFKKDAKVKGLTWYVYGAGINLRFYEPLMNKEYLNIKMTKADFKKIPDILTLNKTNEYINIINLTYKPLAIEFSNIINSDFKNNEDVEWLEKITKDQTNKKEILEFKKFVDKISSVK